MLQLCAIGLYEGTKRAAFAYSHRGHPQSVGRQLPQAWGSLRENGCRMASMVSSESRYPSVLGGSHPPVAQAPIYSLEGVERGGRLLSISAARTPVPQEASEHLDVCDTTRATSEMGLYALPVVGTARSGFSMVSYSGQSWRDLGRSFTFPRFSQLIGRVGLPQVGYNTAMTSLPLVFFKMFLMVVNPTYKNEADAKGAQMGSVTLAQLLVQQCGYQNIQAGSNAVILGEPMPSLGEQIGESIKLLKPVFLLVALRELLALGMGTIILAPYFTEQFRNLGLEEDAANIAGGISGGYGGTLQSQGVHNLTRLLQNVLKGAPDTPVTFELMHDLVQEEVNQCRELPAMLRGVAEHVSGVNDVYPYLRAWFKNSLWRGFVIVPVTLMLYSTTRKMMKDMTREHMRS